MGKAAVISSELLVGALPVEHHFEPRSAGLLEYTPLRENAGAAIRLVLVPGDPFGQSERVLETRVAPVGDAPRALDHRFHERAFVDALLVVAGADAVDLAALSRSAELARHQADDRGAVEPARQAGPHRHVRAQVDAHGIGKQRAKALSGLALADVEGSRLQDPIPSADW